MAAANFEDNVSESEDSRSDNEDFVDESDEDDLENLVRDIFGDSDSENEDDFEGFAVEMPDNVNWTFRGQPVREQDDMFVHDQPNAGPTIDLDQNTKPIDIFKLFFTDEIISNIADWTNRNYARKRRLHPNKHRGKWTDTNPDEIRAALAVFIIMNDMIIVPRFDRYFTSDDSKWFLHIPGVPHIFTRDRFRQLKRYMHFCDPDEELLQPENRDYDRLHKIRPLVSYLQDKFESVYYPSKKLSLDESMIPFKGRLKFKQRMPLKPVKVGIKMFVVSEAQTGYCHKFQIYLGKEGEDNGNEGDLGKTGLVCVRLLRGLQHKGFQVYFDNFYTSVPLFYYLSSRGISACGTMRTNRKFFPREMLSEAVPGLTRGEFVWASYKDLLALTWKDRKAVSFLSTIHDPDLGEQVTRRQKVGGRYQERQVNCPKLVNDYNRYMGGVDKNDQLAIVRKEMKQLSWYNRVFIKLLEMAIYNSYVMEETVKTHRNPAGKVIRGVLDFKDDLVSQLVGNVRAPRRSAGRKRTREERNNGRFDTATRLTNVGDHLPAKGEGKDHHCVVCSEKQIRWLNAHPGVQPKDCPLKVPRTTFCCLGCDELPRRGKTYLCINRERNCFVDYHTKVEFWK